jgi:hypothetical protein
MNLKLITDKDLIVFLVATGHEIIKSEKELTEIQAWYTSRTR